jgi:hypothetical protein
MDWQRNPRNYQSTADHPLTLESCHCAKTARFFVGEESERDAVVAEAADEVGRAGDELGAAVNHPVHVEEESDVLVHAMERAGGVPCRISGGIVR